MTDTSRRDLAHLLARARGAINAPTHLPDEDRAALLHALARAEVYIGSDTLWPIDIHVGSIHHRLGFDHYVALSRRGLLVQIGAFCRKNWPAVNDAREPHHLDDETVTRLYFDRHPDQYLKIDHIELAPSPPSLAPTSVETGWYCVLGTAHLSTSTADLLDQWCSKECQDRPINVASSIYGWFVPTRRVDPVIEAELPEDLLAAMNFARPQGFDHIQFDCDPAITEALLVHDW